MPGGDHPVGFAQVNRFVGGGQCDHEGAGGLSRLDSGRRVLDHDAFGRLDAQPLGSEQVGVRGGLAGFDILAGDQNLGMLESEHPQVGERSFETGRGGDGNPAAVKGAVQRTPVFANTGVRADNVAAQLAIADGAIVGTTFKVDGYIWSDVDQRRVAEFMQAARAARG